MQETLYQTADAEVSLSDSGCKSLSIRQRMQETVYRTPVERLLHPLSDRVSPSTVVYQTVDAGDTLTDSGYRSLFIRQPMQQSLYQTADTVDTL